MGLRWCISILLVMVVQEGMKGANAMNSHSTKPRGTVKTIETEYREVVDCVDIYQQPAFSNPLLKNHSLQMKPNSVPRSLKPEEKSSLIQIQTCPCPKGTVPIRRPFKNESNARKLLSSSDNAQGVHKWALVDHTHGVEDIYGVSATLSVWNPFVEDSKDFSLAQVWLVNDVIADQGETVEAGWMIYKDIFGDYQTRLFIFFTNDGYRSSCYNLECNGFVLTDPKFGVGSPIGPYSVYDGDQFEITIAIVKDKTTQNWWLYYQNNPVGYWPSSLFKRLSTAATLVEWGGEIYEDPTSNHPTTTQMGSGHFAGEGANKAAYIKNMVYIDINHNEIIPTDVGYVISKPLCYNVSSFGNDGSGAFFYFGGPGAKDNPICT